MGIITKSMHTFALQEIHRAYSSFNGWNLREEKMLDNDEMTVLLERMNGGTKETTKILVSYNSVITPDVLEDLKVSGVSNFGRPLRHGYAIIVPKNADISQIPAGVRVCSMSSFAIKDGALLWEKRPVRKTAGVPVATAQKVAA